jgi:hypothetical protein
VTSPERPLAAVAVIAFAQGLALLVYAVFDVVEAVRVGITGPTEVSNLPAVVLLVVITALFGLGMAWVGVGWWRGRSWARAPFILAQLIGGFIGVGLAQSSGAVERTVGIVLVAVALLGLVLAFSPAVNRRLGD